MALSNRAKARARTTRRFLFVWMKPMVVVLVVGFAAQVAPRHVGHTATAAASDAASAPALTLKAIIGGTSHDVDYSEPHLFLGVGPRVVVLDATDPERPIELGETPLMRGPITSLAHGGDLVAAGISVDDGAETELCIVDVADPASPEVRGCVPLAGAPVRIVVQGDIVYSAVYPTGLDIHDLSDPDAPAHLATFTTDEPAYDLDIADGRAYVAVERVTYRIGGTTGEQRGIMMVDITEPTAPTEIGVFNGDIPDGRMITERLRVRGDRGYALGGGLFSVYDLTDPDDALLLSRLTTTGATGSQIVVGERDAWLVHPPASVAATRIDISDPIAPRVIGRLEDIVPDIAWNGVAVADRLAVATRMGGYDLVEVTAPESGSVRRSYKRLGIVYDVALRGDLLVAAASLRGIVTFDIADPSAPRQLGQLFRGPREANAIALNGDLAYALFRRWDDFPSRLDVVDVSDPAEPRVELSIDLDTDASDLVVHDGRLHVVGLDHVVFDLSDPRAPTRVDFIPLSSQARNIAITGERAFLGTSISRLLQIDLSDPVRPIELTSLEAPDPILGLAAHGDVLFAATERRGLATYDLSGSDGATPGESDESLGWLRDVAVSAGRAWALKARRLIALNTDAPVDPDPSGRSALDLPISVRTLGLGEGLDSLIVATGDGIALIGFDDGLAPEPTATAPTTTPGPTATGRPATPTVGTAVPTIYFPIVLRNHTW